MREAELRRIFRRAVFMTGLVMAGAVVPGAAAAQTTAQDSARMTQGYDNDNDDDGMDIGWIGLLGLAGLLGLRRRDNVDSNYRTTTGTRTTT